MKSHLCQRCGETLQHRGDLWICPICAATYSEDDAQSAKQAMEEVLEEAKIELLANRRRVLWQAAHDAHISDKKIKRAAADVRAIYEEDVLARFYLAAIDEDPASLNRFLLEEPLDRYNAREAVRFALLSLDSRNILALSSFVEERFEGKEQSRYLEQIAEEAENIDSGVYMTSLPRDVFLAYSSRDNDDVIQIADYLESEGFSCFVASRNLRHGKGAVENYQKAIYDALKHCKTFVFLSSESSRDLHCEAMEKELPFSLDYLPKQTRIQYLLEKPGRKTSDAAKKFLKSAFPNQEWCTDLGDLSERIRSALAKTDKVCFHCGEINDAKATHCQKCGYPLDESSYKERIEREKKQEKELSRLKDLEKEQAMEAKLRQMLESRLKEQETKREPPKEKEIGIEAKLQQMLERRLKEERSSKTPSPEVDETRSARFDASSYGLRLLSYNGSVIAASKAVNAVFSLGDLSLARQKIDILPVDIATNLSYDEAREKEDALTKAGWKVELLSPRPKSIAKAEPDYLKSYAVGKTLHFGSFFKSKTETAYHISTIWNLNGLNRVPDRDKGPICWRIVKRNGNVATLLSTQVLSYMEQVDKDLGAPGYRSIHDFQKNFARTVLGELSEALVGGVKNPSEELLRDPAAGFYAEKNRVAKPLECAHKAIMNIKYPPELKAPYGPYWIENEGCSLHPDSFHHAYVKEDGTFALAWNDTLLGIRPLIDVDLEVLHLFGIKAEDDKAYLRQIEDAKTKKAEEERLAEEREKAELEAKKKAEEEAWRKAEEEAKKKEEARRLAQEEAKRKEEAEAKRKAEEEAKKKAQEEEKALALKAAQIAYEKEKEEAQERLKKTPALTIREGRLYYGHYPSSRVREGKLEYALNKLPTTEEDVCYNGNFYRRQGKRWYRFSPIEWVVAKVEEDGAILVCANLLDKGPYCRKGGRPQKDDPSSHHIIEGFLNGTFKETAFPNPRPLLALPGEKKAGISLLSQEQFREFRIDKRSAATNYAERSEKQITFYHDYWILKDAQGFHYATPDGELRPRTQDASSFEAYIRPVIKLALKQTEMVELGLTPSDKTFERFTFSSKVSRQDAGKIKAKAVGFANDVLIEDECFYQNQTLSRVEFPAEVLDIGDDAFNGCINLKHVSWPTTLKRFTGVRAFAETSIVSISIKNHPDYIPKGAFQDCKSLKKAAFSYQVAAIGDGAFEGCGNLKEFHLGWQNVSIRFGDRCFAGCVSLDDAPLPHAGYIGVEAFSGCPLNARSEWHVLASAEVKRAAFKGCRFNLVIEGKKPLLKKLPPSWDKDALEGFLGTVRYER